MVYCFKLHWCFRQCLSWVGFLYSSFSRNEPCFRFQVARWKGAGKKVEICSVL